jgi:hypothetical protein
VERSFAHCYETGAMRRVHLRRHPNILKRLLVHGAAFNLGLVRRQLLGRGTPRGLQGHAAALFSTFLQLLHRAWASLLDWKAYAAAREALPAHRSLHEPFTNPLLATTKNTVSTTGC